jgi:hypothetical protein
MVLRPDTSFVLYFNAFSHKCDGGYQAYVFEGAVKKLGDTLGPVAALAYLAAHSDAVVSVLHV